MNSKEKGFEVLRIKKLLVKMQHKMTSEEILSYKKQIRLLTPIKRRAYV